MCALCLGLWRTCFFLDVEVRGWLDVVRGKRLICIFILEDDIKIILGLAFYNFILTNVRNKIILLHI